MISMILEAVKEHSETMAIGDLCAALGVPRAAFYRERREIVRENQQGNTVELRDAIQRIALLWPAYGYRRITAELRRRGFIANHKRVLRLMRSDNLLCLRSGSMFVTTTDSRHQLPVYPNLAKGL